MKIPIDVFQILGLIPNADNKTILNTLEKKINRVEIKGLSEKTMANRNKILKQMGTILIETNESNGYVIGQDKDQLIGLTKETELPLGYEVAGLILLLEADQPEECLEIGKGLYERLRSSVDANREDEEDLRLILDNAALVYAKELKEDRFYEKSAEVLTLRLMAGGGIYAQDTQRKLRDELERLMPFRVLDLLSRKGTEEAHKQGLFLLKEMVDNRGGLELESNRYIKKDEFVLFFNQIRKYLTVQEQIDLYRGWAHKGSSVSLFLAGISLVAAGFSQRKPEKLIEGLNQLNRINTDSLETIKANIYLLLGDVRQADEMLNQYSNEELTAWCLAKGASRLAQLCAWCEEWLQRDVLSGYRDIDLEADLDAYFADQDVIRYIESKDRMDNGDTRSTEKMLEQHAKSYKADINLRKARKNWVRIIQDGFFHRKLKTKKFESRRGESIIAIVLIISFISISIIAQSKNSISTRNEKGKVFKVDERSDIDGSNRGTVIGYNIRSGDLNWKKQYSEALNNWLMIKRVILSGEPPPKNADLYGSAAAIKRLQKERDRDIKHGERLIFNFKVISLEMVNMSKDRVVIEAVLSYDDKRVNTRGEILSEVKPHFFKKKYTLIKWGDRWHVQ